MRGISFVLAMLLVACGGGGDDNADPMATTQVTQNVAADRALAEQAVLRLSDFPPG